MRWVYAVKSLINLKKLLSFVQIIVIVNFLDAGLYVSMNKIDYMHLDLESHKRLGKRIADVIGKKV